MCLRKDRREELERMSKDNYFKEFCFKGEQKWGSSLIQMWGSILVCVFDWRNNIMFVYRFSREGKLMLE